MVEKRKAIKKPQKIHSEVFLLSGYEFSLDIDGEIIHKLVV